MNLYESINNLKEESLDSSNENRAEHLVTLLKQAILTNSDSKVEYSDYDKVIWIRSGNFEPESISKYSNSIDFEGRLYLDDNFNFVKTDIKTSSGPNLLNQSFILQLNALYTFVKSNGQHWEG